MIIQNDYRKLSLHTKKQKRYYEQAERRARRKARAHMDSLFEQIEAELKQKEAANTGVFIGQAM